MSLHVGYLDPNGHPRLKIKITGTNPGVFVEVDALIDTGFTGFLMLPLVQALPLGLILHGTGDYTLADGSTVTNFLAKGTITIVPPEAPPSPTTVPAGEERIDGIIVLAGDGALVGMEFLRNLNKVLMLGAGGVFLVGAEDLQALAQATEPGSKSTA